MSVYKKQLKPSIIEYPTTEVPSSTTEILELKRYQAEPILRSSEPSSVNFLIKEPKNQALNSTFGEDKSPTTEKSSDVEPQAQFGELIEVTSEDLLRSIPTSTESVIPKSSQRLEIDEPVKLQVIGEDSDANLGQETKNSDIKREASSTTELPSLTSTLLSKMKSDQRLESQESLKLQEFEEESDQNGEQESEDLTRQREINSTIDKPREASESPSKEDSDPIELDQNHGSDESSELEKTEPTGEEGTSTTDQSSTTKPTEVLPEVSLNATELQEPHHSTETSSNEMDPKPISTDVLSTNDDNDSVSNKH